MRRGLCFTWFLGALLLGNPSSLCAGDLVLEVEVMESSDGMAIPGAGLAHVRFAVIHHKHERDQTAFSEWLRGHQSGSVSFVASDGNSHRGILHRLKHCFGRGLLLYINGVSLVERAVIQLELPVAP